MFDVQVTDLGNSLYMIDAGMHDEPERLACYLFDTPTRVLIECGPSNVLPNLVAALDSIGIDDVAAMVVTHIHLDHAGGAGHFAERFPESLIGVHARGARHLADPTRLWDSAERIYTPEGMQTLWGPMQPVPEDRLLVLDEGSAISLGGGRQLEVMYTPGHAKHHIVFTEEGSGGMFVGDSVGIAFPHGHMVQPVTPPPDFDEPLVVRQLRRMAARQPGFVGFAHYGVTSHVARVFDQAEARLGEWVSFVESLGEAADASDRLRDWVLGAYQSEGIPEEDIDQYDRNTFWPMQVTGIQRWLTQQDDG
ncbi:MAG: MBL fold metallo-hydrolase [Acidimicrobiia bacterium]|nr:MBL fold metallo-hydrolase [Acidimicrobiia bacterium]MBT8194488.1 MBL fold metallo-hydrolase [Acidimicrobiia bacterium]NNF89241.1 MBL fold metallo-hydrolase [Acidimicrobiia bacterium]NNJ47751.1 MBL fold metallo-hydrolase [Acidimicrobiia bacterium]NNL13902.1 MBL fold metallo-hydrolase [Acidimicrobiia bacterium]